jgi:uncharacterized protein YxeA
MQSQNFRSFFSFPIEFSLQPSFLYFVALIIIVGGLIFYNMGSETEEEYSKLTESPAPLNEEENKSETIES